MSTDRESLRPNDRCDKCGTHISEWDEKPCIQSLTQSPRHTITRFHFPIPLAAPLGEGERTE